MCLCCEPRRKYLWLAKLDRSSHGATADGSYGSISAASTKPERHFYNRTIRGSMRETQAYLTRKLRERDLGRDLEGAKITLNDCVTVKFM